MISEHLIQLHKILSLMVKDKRISLIERNSILSKAGLYYRDNSEWHDDNGVIYNLED
jgi:hypothetical protein